MTDTPASSVPSIGRPRTKAEVAELLQVSDKAVQRHVSSGRLRCLRDGGILRFTDEHINEFIQAAESPTPTPEPLKPTRNPKYGQRDRPERQA